MHDIIYTSLKETLGITEGLGFLGSVDKGYLFSGSWEALVVIFRDLGSNLIMFIVAKSKVNLKISP